MSVRRAVEADRAVAALPGTLRMSDCLAEAVARWRREFEGYQMGDMVKPSCTESSRTVRQRFTNGVEVSILRLNQRQERYSLSIFGSEFGVLTLSTSGYAEERSTGAARTVVLMNVNFEILSWLPQA